MQLSLRGALFMCTYTIMLDHVRAAARISRECTCMRVRQASRVLTKIYDTELRPTGLQESQVSVLVAIARFGERGATIGNLAGALKMDRTTVTRNLGPLEKSGLVRVARSPDDARVRTILLSRAGEAMIVSALPLWERAQKKVRDALGDELLADVSINLGRVAALGDPAS
jgi:DNA-binding MarR family transcriptional regulator